MMTHADAWQVNTLTDALTASKREIERLNKCEGEPVAGVAGGAGPRHADTPAAVSGCVAGAADVACVMQSAPVAGDNWGLRRGGGAAGQGGASVEEFQMQISLKHEATLEQERTLVEVLLLIARALVFMRNVRGLVYAALSD
jgi:hypothetical protein